MTLQYKLHWYVYVQVAGVCTWFTHTTYLCTDRDRTAAAASWLSNALFFVFFRTSNFVWLSPKPGCVCAWSSQSLHARQMTAEQYEMNVHLHVSRCSCGCPCCVSNGGGAVINTTGQWRCCVRRQNSGVSQSPLLGIGQPTNSLLIQICTSSFWLSPRQHNLLHNQTVILRIHLSLIICIYAEEKLFKIL